MSGSVSAPANHPTEVPRPVPTETPPGNKVSDEQISQTASDILETGHRPFIIVDDYDARAVHFGEELAKLSPEDGARLIQEVMRQDPGALHSWLKLDIIDRMQSEGRLDQAGYEAIAESFVQAYNEGRISQQDADTFLLVYNLTNAAPGIADKQYGQVREFLDAAGTTEAALEFREAFAENLLSRHLPGQNAPFHAAGLAMQIAADSGDPDMAARVFNDVLEANGGSAATREALISAIGESSIGFRNSMGVIDDLANPMVTLIDSIAGQPDTLQWNDIAVAITRYAEGASDDVFFDFYNDDKPFADTAQALSGLLASPHGDAVMASLTHWNNNGTSGGNGHAQQFGQNAIEMGNLLRITAFNPDNPAADVAMTAVGEWVQMRKDFLNGVERSDYPADLDVSTARQQLGMMGGAAFDAVRTMQLDQENREAATRALVGFVIDVGVSLIPGGGKISALVAKDLKASFGNDPMIDRIIDQALKQGDTLTTSQINSLKDEITGALSESQADLEVMRTTASSFVANSVVSGLPGGSADGSEQAHRDIIESHIQVVQTEIQDNRA